MLFILIYITIGDILGCYLVYKMLEEWGWQHLFDDFNKRLEKPTEFKVFKFAFPIFTVAAITLTWPYFIYLFVNKKYFK